MWTCPYCPGPKFETKEELDQHIYKTHTLTKISENPLCYSISGGSKKFAVGVRMLRELHPGVHFQFVSDCLDHDNVVVRLAIAD